MFHQVNWNRRILDEFIEKGNLNQDEITAIEMRCKDVPRYLIADKLSISESSVARMTEKLKLKYDALAEMYPDIFPPRRIPNSYDIEYKNFTGNFSAYADDRSFEIDFRNQKFESLEDARRFVVAEIEEMTEKKFCTLDSAHITITLDFDLNITEKRDFK